MECLKSQKRKIQTADIWFESQSQSSKRKKKDWELQKVWESLSGLGGIVDTPNELITSSITSISIESWQKPQLIIPASFIFFWLLDMPKKISSTAAHNQKLSSVFHQAQGNEHHEFEKKLCKFWVVWNSFLSNQSCIVSNLHSFVWIIYT